MMNKFLERHKLGSSHINMDDLVTVFIEEMERGLRGDDSSLRMIPTYIEAENDFLTGTSVLAIDAGGTNFRAALITFNEVGQPEIGEIHKHRMPGIEQEISADEFFNTIADYIRPLADDADRIGFCFSYPTEILPDRDGRLLHFSKEIQAPEVVGKLIGRNLLKALGSPEKEVVLLNDTVATLLAGKCVSYRKSHDSHIGYILGTGTNTCYIEKNRNILKKNYNARERSQIINIESGNFSQTPSTDLDLRFDETTTNPGYYTFEKMISGAYFGGLYLTVLKAASEENLFSEEATRHIQRLNTLTTEQANAFAGNRFSKETILGRCFNEPNDADLAFQIIEALIERAAVLVAANLAAVVLKTGKGKSADRPVLITAEGTTFYKLHNLSEQVHKHLSEYLTGDKKRYLEFTSVSHSSLMGAALAALIKSSEEKIRV